MTIRVLIVDDQSIFARNLARFLQADGVVAEVAVSVAQARARLRSGPFDLFCLDVRLPDGNGLDVLAEVRRAYPVVPAIVMSGEGSRDTETRAFALGAAAFLTKPFSLHEIRAKVREASTETPPFWQYRDTDRAGSSASACVPVRAGDSRYAPTVMMYSHDGFGVGHLRRTVNIATGIVNQLPGVNVLVLCGSPSIGLFDLPVGVDVIKLPSIVKVENNQWEPGSLTLSADEVRNLRGRLILRTAELFAPRVLLVDHMPRGVWGDLIPTLEMFRRLDRPPTVMLGLRDILDAPEVVRSNWRDDGTFDTIDSLYDEILIYGRREIFDSAGAYGLDALTRATVHFCGYICTQGEPVSPDTMRDRLGATASRLVLVTAGGGRDAFPMMDASLDALREMGGDGDVSAVFITGPLMCKEHRDALECKAAGTPFRVLKSVSDALSHINAADVVVTMGGYNTLMETLRLNKRTIVIPRPGPSAEQTMRASALAELGAVDVVPLDHADPARLGRAIRAALDAEQDPPKLDLGGGGTAAVVDRVLSVLGDDGTLTSGQAPAPSLSMMASA